MNKITGENSGICCFLGHRAVPENETERLNRRLDETIGKMAERGVTNYLCGGSVGFDMMAGFAVIRRRESNPRIRLTIVEPCRGHTAKWSDGDKSAYEELKRAADKVTCLSVYYKEGVFSSRNRHLVEHSGVCVAYLTQNHGGTVTAVRYAREKGLEVINLA